MSKDHCPNYSIHLGCQARQGDRRIPCPQVAYHGVVYVCARTLNFVVIDTHLSAQAASAVRTSFASRVVS